MQHKLQANVRSVINSHGDEYKKIWLTEIGWNTSTTSPTGLGNNPDNEQRQAEFIEHLYDLIYESRFRRLGEQFPRVPDQ